MSNLLLDDQVVPSLAMPIENTDDKQTADEHQKQKLESMGLLASSIAHDFNNLLTGMIAHLSLATKNLTEEDQAQIFVQKALNSAQKAVNLAQSLLDFATTGSATGELVDVNILIQNSLPLLQLAATNIELQLNLTERLPPVYLVKTQLQQLLINLILNAVEAIVPNSGVVEINTALISHLPENLEAVTIGQPKLHQNYVMLRVTDTGRGMSYATMKQIIVPFFTTKEHGHGLGLTTIIDIVHNHDGVFRVESMLGYGSTFSIYLPVAQITP